VAAPFLAALAIVGLHLGCSAFRARSARGPYATRVERLGLSRIAPHAYGRAGDLVLRDGSGAALTFATSLDQAGHRPLHGALLDAAIGDEDRTDPLLWWRAGWLDAELRLHVGPAEDVVPVACPEGAPGLRIAGTVDAVRLETEVCPVDPGTFAFTTTARGLPPGAVLADELNPGTATVLADDDGADWEGERPSPFVVLADAGIAMALEAPDMRVQRHFVHIAAESFPTALLLRCGGTAAARRLHVLRGDALDGLGRLPGSTRALTAGLLGDHGGEVALLDAAGRVMVHAPVAALRELRLPPLFASGIELRDANGVLAARSTLAAVGRRFAVEPPAAGEVSVRYVDGSGSPLPVHVLLRSLGGGEDPSPRVTGDGFAAGRSVYLLRGSAVIALAPGRYRLTATHGTTYSLDTREITVTGGVRQSVEARLDQVIDTSAWTSADFHLHAAPSPDSSVSLDERIASLVCEGVELAAATDHNRITDYAPNVARLGLSRRIVTVAGDEITSAGAALWGHFNAYPLPIGAGAPEDVVPAYFDTLPEGMFAAARDAGARIVQVNHPRMDPRIGYFDLTHLDPRTGSSDASFSPAFQAVEAFNGMWIESPDKVRQGAIDLVALARRGMRVAATGNSDSHRLLYEEAGYPRTFVHAPAEPIAARTEGVLSALVRGDTTLSSGPFVEISVDGMPPGAVVRASTSHHVRVHVRVSAPVWVPLEHVEVWRNDVVAQRFDVAGPPRDGVRFEGDVDLSFDEDGVILAWADAKTPLPDVLPYPNARAIGFTGLVYVDADGDGRVVVPQREPR
jgi:hypothetical protein